MRLIAMSGESRRLAEFRGRPLVVNVWASWCGPCRAEMPSLERLSRNGAERVRVIGVSTDDDPNLAREFLLRTGVSFPNFQDLDQKLEREVFGAAAIPLTLVVDADGRVLERVLGARDWDSPQSRDLIERLLGQPQKPE
ncbi:MAG: TlpA family protein disulfide reductase [Rhodocyclaceae bacterium]|nr:TlpA family protein disulfide reductase [Rhodocyclaceae bacterium]